MKSGRRNKISPDTSLKVNVRIVSFSIRNLKKRTSCGRIRSLWHETIGGHSRCCFLILWEQSEKVGMPRRERRECSG